MHSISTMHFCSLKIGYYALLNHHTTTKSQKLFKIDITFTTFLFFGIFRLFVSYFSLVQGAFMSTNIKTILDIAKFYLNQHTNIRATAQYFGLSKSTIHNYLHYKLKFVDLELFKRVEIQAKLNFDNKHIFGGIATKKKYLQKYK